MGILGTRAPLTSDIGLALEIVTTLLFTSGYFLDRRRGKHCLIMGGAAATNTVFVISYMISRLLREEIPSPPAQFSTLYRSLVIPHGILSVVVLILAIAQAFLAYHWRTKRDNILVLENRRTVHKKLGIASLVLWYFSFISGVVVYAILYIA